MIAYAIWLLIGIGMSLRNPAGHAELLPSLLGRGGKRCCLLPPSAVDSPSCTPVRYVAKKNYY